MGERNEGREAEIEMGGGLGGRMEGENKNGILIYKT